VWMILGLYQDCERPNVAVTTIPCTIHRLGGLAGNVWRLSLWIVQGNPAIASVRLPGCVVADIMGGTCRTRRPTICF
jgi:hypothetical protein